MVLEGFLASFGSATQILVRVIPRRRIVAENVYRAVNKDKSVISSGNIRDSRMCYLIYTRACKSYGCHHRAATSHTCRMQNNCQTCITKRSTRLELHSSNVHHPCRDSILSARDISNVPRACAPPRDVPHHHYHCCEPHQELCSHHCPRYSHPHRDLIKHELHPNGPSCLPR